LKAASSCNLTFDPVSGQQYPVSVNVSCLCSNPEASATLYRNGTNVTDEIGTNVELGAGNYDYVCNVSETINYLGSSNSTVYAIDKASTFVNLSLNSAENNVTVTYPDTITATFSTNALTAIMYREGADVSGQNGTPVTLGTGTYNYTVSNAGNENYTSSSKTFFATVQQNSSTTCSLSFNPVSSSYGTPLNVSCACTNPEATAELYRNGTDVTSEIDTEVTLAAGNYNYVCNVTSSQNYTSVSNSSVYAVSKATPTIGLTLNGNDSNITIEAGSTVTFNVTLSQNDFVYLYENDSLLGNDTTPFSFSKQYNITGDYEIKANYSGNKNYTNSSIMYVLTIQDTTAPQFTNLANQTVAENETLVYDIDATDLSGISCFEVNDTTNFNINCSGYLTNATDLSPGVYWLNITVNDTSGNENYGIIYVNVTDVTAPTITLNDPIDNYNSTSQQVQFNCTALDNVALTNVTLYGNWSGWHANETNISGVNGADYLFTKTIPDGDYLWNCKACDNSGYCAFAIVNRTLNIVQDTDGDGIPDNQDFLEWFEDNVTTTGIDNLSVTVDGNGTYGTYDLVREVRFSDGAKLLMNFTHNFSTFEINLTLVSLNVDDNHIFVNLSNQLNPGERKTLYLDDNNFVSLCVKDETISSISEMSPDCNQTNETSFDSCIGNSTGVTINNITCYDHGSAIEINNLVYSAIRGTPVVTPPGGPGGGGGGGGAKKTCTVGYELINGKCVIVEEDEEVEVIEPIPPIEEPVEERIVEELPEETLTEEIIKEATIEFPLEKGFCGKVFSWLKTWITNYVFISVLLGLLSLIFIILILLFIYRRFSEEEERTRKKHPERVKKERAVKTLLISDISRIRKRISSYHEEGLKETPFIKKEITRKRKILKKSNKNVKKFKKKVLKCKTCEDSKRKKK